MSKVLATSAALILLTSVSSSAIAATLTSVEPLVYRFDHGQIGTTSTLQSTLRLSFGEPVPQDEGFELSLGNAPGDNSYGSTTFRNNFPLGMEVENINYNLNGTIIGGQPSTWYSQPTTTESYLTITHNGYNAEIAETELRVLYQQGINNTGSCLTSAPMGPNRVIC